jgi:ABC-type transporter MlaC component
MGLPFPARGEQPINILQKSVNETIRLLKDPQYQGDDQKTVQQQKLDEIARRMFDFSEFSMRVLGSNWNRFSMQERSTFTDVFSRFLSKYYIGELQKKYTDEKVIFLNQELLADSKALVKVKVLWKDMEIPVNVWMRKRSGRWKAYDVSAYGVSAVQNYRAQLWALTLNNSPGQIIELIKIRMQEEGKGEGI